MMTSKISIYFQLKWLKLMRKIGKRSTESVFYIGGAEALPPPLTAEEEN